MLICPPRCISHCADAVISLANNATVVGDVGTTITQFVTRWVQTPSDYDFLVATTMTKDWIHRHQPVISRHSTGHQLYSRFSVESPRGMRVLCHRRECNQVLKYRIHGEQVHISCPGCGSKCRIPKFVTDSGHVLGRAGIVRVVYPPPEFPTEWRLPTEGPLRDQARPPRKTTPIITRRPQSVAIPPPPPASDHRPPPPAHLRHPLDHRSSQLSHSVSLDPLPTPPPKLKASSSSSSLYITVPPLNSAITRSRSTPAIRNQSATPTPPPQSPHEPSPTPSEGKRPLAGGSSSRAQKRQKKQKDRQEK